VVLVTTKPCTQCSEIKDLSEFYWNKALGRYQSECKRCNNKRTAAYREKNKERLIAQNRIWQKNNPERVKAAQERWKAKNPDLARQRAAEWYRENREMVRARERERYHELKDQIYAAYGGYRCSCCGETEPKFLTIHVNNDGNERRKELRYGVGKAGGGIGLYMKIAELGFPSDYQVLCMNCNWGKARNNGVCPHETAKVQRSG
jgi:hypothetical protein